MRLSICEQAKGKMEGRMGAKEEIKENFEKVRTPTGTMQSLKGCFTTDGDFSSLKIHDWHKVL